jgi:hypothetical protein
MRDPTSCTSLCRILGERLDTGHKHFELHWDKWTSHGTCFVRKVRPVDRITDESSRHIQHPKALFSSRGYYLFTIHFCSFRYWIQNCTSQVIRRSLRNKKTPCDTVYSGRSSSEEIIAFIFRDWEYAMQVTAVFSLWFLLGLLINSDDGSSMFLRNFGERPPHYTASRPRRQYVS